MTDENKRDETQERAEKLEKDPYNPVNMSGKKAGIVDEIEDKDEAQRERGEGGDAASEKTSQRPKR